MSIDTSDKLRRVILRPYRKDAGPVFTLETYATSGRDWRGCTTIAYRFRMRERGRSRVIFEGADFHGSPMHADDSNATLASLLTFLTLRPGDTDREYFDSYTDAQMDFATSHGEYLGFEATQRFGES